MFGFEQKIDGERRTQIVSIEEQIDRHTNSIHVNANFIDQKEFPEIKAPLFGAFILANDFITVSTFEFGCGAFTHSAQIDLQFSHRISGDFE